MVMSPINPQLYRGLTHQTALAIRRTPITQHKQRRQIIKVPAERLPLPTELSPGFVLVMIYMCQICDTDIELGTNPGHGAVTRGFDPRDLTHDDKVPWVLNGHEAGGAVIAFGEGVSRVNIGDWVSLKVREGMKSTECIMCEANMTNRCLDWQFVRNDVEASPDMEEHGIFRAPGWFCHYSVLHEKQVIKIPHGMPPEYASMGEPLSISANAFMTAIDRWYADPGFLEATRDGPPAIAVVGAGGLASIAAPLFSQWPENFREAINRGDLPSNYFDRPFAEQRRRDAGMHDKVAAAAEVFYYARSRYKPGLHKADVVRELGIRYESFEDLGLPYIEVVQTGALADGRDHVDRVYNLSPLLQQPTRGRFDLVIEMCTNPLQIARMMLPPSEPGEMRAFTEAISEGGDDARCEGRYVMPPTTPDDVAAFMTSPRWGCGGLMAPGTKLVITSITSGEEVYPNFPVAKFAWMGTLNNTDILGVVNYDEYHTKVALVSLDMILKKPGLDTWPSKVQEKIVENFSDLLGEGMYDIKAAYSGRVAVKMNQLEDIEETIRIARGEA